MSENKYQLFITAGTVVLESYRVFTGTLLVVFVPGVCNGKRCLPIENYQKGDTIYRIGFVCNFITLLFFINLYRAELIRENKFNHYLRIDPHAPTDSDSVGKELIKLTPPRQQAILRINKDYQRIGIVTIGIFIVNTVISIYIIVSAYMDDRAMTTIVSSTVLIAGKLYDLCVAINSDKNILTSAYRKQKVQFNTANPSKILTDVPTIDPHKIEVTANP